MIQHYHVPRLLAADIDAVIAHFFEHIAVANFGSDQAQFLALKVTFQSKI